MNNSVSSRNALFSVLPKILLFAAAGLLLLFVAVGVRASDKPGWLDNQKQALTKAKEGKKLILMDFTGSDWCGWCMKLDKEVFSTPEFRSYAGKNLVLVELDFPHQKYISPQTKKQNEELGQQYNIEGYPTIIVLNSEGKKVGKLGYMEGGPKAFIAALEALPKT